jgi:hypothetical protein
MVSIGPYTQSYVENSPSCFLPGGQKQYTEGSVMWALVRRSPAYAGLVQLAQMDEDLDSMQFEGTCFAPIMQYPLQVGSFDKNTARHFVLCSLLHSKVQPKYLQFFENEVLPTRDRYSYLNVQNTNGQTYLNQTVRVKEVAVCTNGVLYLTNGLIKPMIP